jgi:hydrogenase expression/formation protein HypD
MNDSFLDEFKDPELARRLGADISSMPLGRPVTVMHVCGTHEHAIGRAGIRAVLPEGLRLVAGPGCPVCVCPARDIDLAVAAARMDDVTVATFGDMFRVPTTTSSLEEEKASGGDVRVVYSPIDAVNFAREHPERRVVFMAVGFETTAAPIAASLLAEPPDNFFILPSLRIIPPALTFLLEGGTGPVEGFILPGHVSTVIGKEGYRFLDERFHVPGVIAGFEPVDVLRAVKELVAQISGEKKPAVVNLYRRVVSDEGNRRARETISRVFMEDDVEWRGIGVIPGSGLVLRPEFKRLDAVEHLGLSVDTEPVDIRPGCLCHKVILGESEPEECKLFGDACTPRKPYGPCMVSSEGTCRARYQYRPVQRSPRE